MIDYKDFGKRIRVLRRAQRITQEELAEKLNVSRQAVSKWECGESLPDTDNLITIARLYGVSLDELVDNVPDGGREVATADGDTCVQPIEELDEDEREEAEAEAYYSQDGQPADKKRRILRVLHAFPYPILTTVAFLLWGFLAEGWAVSWTLFLTIPLYYTVIECIRQKRWKPFAYPVLVAFVYLFLGMQWGLWHPYWIVFITIPIYYAVVEALDRK